MPIRGWTRTWEEELISQHTRKFVDNNIKTTERVYINMISSFKNDFEAVVVGSDQVWRYKYLGKSILEFFYVPFQPQNINYRMQHRLEQIIGKCLIM